MASDASDEQAVQVPITVLVNKEKNKVLYAEAGKDFVDVLLSFLTLPLGTIARLVAKESNIEAVHFGSISSLYHSVSDLGEEHLCNRTCKEILLQPRNSMEDWCQKMKLNIDDSEILQFSDCQDDECCREDGDYAGTFKDQRCICGKLLNVFHPGGSTAENGFVNKTSTFIISDDLFLMPNLLGTSLNLLQKLGVNDLDTIDKQTVNISKKDVVDLLKLSLLSKTPLSDFIFKKEHFVVNLDPRNRLEYWIGDVDGDVDEPHDESFEMVVKVVRRKSNEQILFVEGDEDFADFVLRFLIFPLGGVFDGHSFLSCIDNLYNSMTELNPDRCLMSKCVKDKLSEPGIGGITDNYFIVEKDHTTEMKFVKSSFSEGFVRRPMTFMVTDDLVVSQMSSISGLAYLQKLKVPLNDVDERVINIGLKEGFSILRASLTSTSSLTNGLSLSIMKQFLR